MDRLEVLQKLKAGVLHITGHAPNLSPSALWYLQGVTRSTLTDFDFS